MRHRGSGRLAQALGLESIFFPVYHARRSVLYFASPIALAQRFRSCCRSAARTCALLSALEQWRARKIIRSLLAGWLAGGASHCRSASSNCWFGDVGSIQFCRFQCSRHFRTLGGPNYSLKSDRCGLACGTIMRSRPQRPLSSTVRPHKRT